MAYEVVLPDLGEDAEDEATVSFWNFEEDEYVEKEDDLVEMTTDKAAFPVPSPVSGTLVEKLVAEGDIVKVGEVLCIIKEED
jgi:pyruvate/2-oxoglutarate dehydrogenase complex dihydrolipoamide acyltransferase (E2) component